MSNIVRSTDTSRPQPSMARALRDLGADLYDLLLPETRSLAGLLLDGETVEGIVYGRYAWTHTRPPGRGALVITDRRLLFVDHKPFYTNTGEITYGVISGIDYASTGFISTVTLNTRLGDVQVRTFNPRAAHGFVRAVEKHIFAQS